MIQYVYQPCRGKSSFRRSVENYRGRFKLPGGRLEDVTLGTPDKRIAEQRLAGLVRERMDEAAGILAPKTMRDAAVKPLTAHLDDYIADLRAKNRAKRYYELVEVRVKTLIAECRWELPKDVTPDSFVSWRAIQTKAAKTLNDYLDAAMVLLNWMRRQGRIAANTLSCVGKVQTVGREVVKRRALTDAEFERLLSVSGGRSVVYLTAVLTGLRRGELRALQWGDVHLDAPKPFMSVRAATTKNRKGAVILLRDDLVTELRGLLDRGYPSLPGGRVFRVPKPETFRRDLQEAGIPIYDEQGRKVDMHALRHTLATNLARGGVAPRVAMEIMRHSDIKLTAKTYTDAGLLPMADAMDKLPRYEVSKKRSQKRSQFGVVGGRDLSQLVAVGDGAESEKALYLQGKSRDLSQAVATCREGQASEGDGARTRNLRIDSPVL